MMERVAGIGRTRYGSGEGIGLSMEAVVCCKMFLHFRGYLELPPRLLGCSI